MAGRSDRRFIVAAIGEACGLAARAISTAGALAFQDVGGDNGAMRYLELTLPTPEENLALDEALLDEAEAAPAPLETLRVWESPEMLVVAGRSSRLEGEVDLTACRQRGIAVVRRPSGGAAVLLGPGCLMYSLVLSHELRPQVRRVDAAHRYVLGKTAAALSELVSGVACAGTSDLILARGSPSSPELLKCSGNSARVKRRHLLYHGTLLYDFPLGEVAHCLPMPPRMPDYRAGRAHSRFLANLPLDRKTLCELLRRAWSAREPVVEWPQARTADLACGKYRQAAWTQYR